MKKIFVIYKENGILKKGELSEDRFNNLNKLSSISEVQTYQNKTLMEQNFGTLLSSNTKTSNLLLG